MLKVLASIFQQCLGSFTMWPVEWSPESLTTSFGVCNSRTTLAMRVIFFSKLSEFDLNSRYPEKD